MGLILKFTIKALLENSDVVKVKEPGLEPVLISHFDHDPTITGNYRLFSGFDQSMPVYSIKEEETTLQPDGRIALRAHRVDSDSFTIVKEPKIPIMLELYQLSPLTPAKLLEKLLPKPMSTGAQRRPG